jgi:NADPH-dependent curcumin reductase CurA
MQVKGFIVVDFRGTPGQEEAMKKVIGLVKAGKIKMDDESETVVDAKFEDIPRTYLKLFSGANRGKLVTQLA